MRHIVQVRGREKALDVTKLKGHAGFGSKHVWSTCFRVFVGGIAQRRE